MGAIMQEFKTHKSFIKVELCKIILARPSECEPENIWVIYDVNRSNSVPNKIARPYFALNLNENISLLSGQPFSLK